MSNRALDARSPSDLQILKYDQYRYGYRIGRSWARETATEDELVHLQQWRTRDGRDWELNFLNDLDSVHTPAERFVFSINPEDKGDCDCAVSFWKSTGIEDYLPQGHFVYGFAGGALAETGDLLKDHVLSIPL